MLVFQTKKHPAEILDYIIDCSAVLDAGDTISSATLGVANGTTVIQGDVTTTDTTVVFWLLGGVPGEKITLSCSITTVGGRTYTDGLSLTIKYVSDYHPIIIPGPDTMNLDRTQFGSILFEDEFSGSSLDTTKWSQQFRWGIPGTLASHTISSDGELEAYVDHMVSVGGGLCTLKAQPTPPADSALAFGRGYESGLLVSKAQWGTGIVVECRAKLNCQGPGLWPALWLASGSLGNELDLMEVIDNHGVWMTSHWRDSSGTYRYFNGGKAITRLDPEAQFITYTVTHTSLYTTWYENDIEVLRCPTQASQNTDLYFIANLAVGGNWPGNPTSNTVFPATMQIDFVRVHQFNGS